jgi:hypothetical protein
MGTMQDMSSVSSGMERNRAEEVEDGEKSKNGAIDRHSGEHFPDHDVGVHKKPVPTSARDHGRH